MTRFVRLKPSPDPLKSRPFVLIGRYKLTGCGARWIRLYAYRPGRFWWKLGRRQFNSNKLEEVYVTDLFGSMSKRLAIRRGVRYLRTCAEDKDYLVDVVEDFA